LGFPEKLQYLKPKKSQCPAHERPALVIRLKLSPERYRTLLHNVMGIRTVGDLGHNITKEYLLVLNQQTSKRFM
jgi:hypothetical protein